MFAVHWYKKAEIRQRRISTENLRFQLFDVRNDIHTPMNGLCSFKFLLATAAATVVTIIVAADAVKDNYDNDYPENPFATATIVVISKAHKSSSFQF